jgi:pimeloyl-ACP methyl ester carboxylesterase
VIFAVDRDGITARLAQSTADTVSGAAKPPTTGQRCPNRPPGRGSLVAAATRLHGPTHQCPSWTQERVESAVAVVGRQLRYVAVMTDFILVAGAWLGSWAWDEAVSELREAGHGAHPVTLSGLAERRGAPAGQQTHVQDVVSEVERLDLRDVVLVGHSYSGIPVGQAAEQIGDRLAQVVFVDSNVPVNGESFASAWWRGRAAFEAMIAENEGFWAPLTAADYDGQGLSEEQIARIVGGSTPHPGSTLTEPARLTRPLGELPATYIKCLLDGVKPSDGVAELLTSEHWRLVEMDTGHWPMFSQPRELVRILIDAARA